MDWLDYSTRLMNARWRGRKVTQLTIGGGVTVAWSQVGESGARFRLEQGFEISDARTGLVAAIEPAHLERGAQAFVDLIWATVRAVRTEPGTVPISSSRTGAPFELDRTRPLSPGHS